MTLKKVVCSKAFLEKTFFLISDSWLLITHTLFFEKVDNSEICKGSFLASG